MTKYIKAFNRAEPVTQTKEEWIAERSHPAYITWLDSPDGESKEYMIPYSLPRSHGDYIASFWSWWVRELHQADGTRLGASSYDTFDLEAALSWMRSVGADSAYLVVTPTNEEYNRRPDGLPWIIVGWDWLSNEETQTKFKVDGSPITRVEGPLHTFGHWCLLAPGAIRVYEETPPTATEIPNDDPERVRYRVSARGTLSVDRTLIYAGEGEKNGTNS